MDNFNVDEILDIGEIILEEIDVDDFDCTSVGSVNIVDVPDFHGGD